MLGHLGLGRVSKHVLGQLGVSSRPLNLAAPDPCRPALLLYLDRHHRPAGRIAGGAGPGAQRLNGCQAFAAWNLAMRSAGTRPRWLTSMPCDSAHARTALGS
jgi:hypothetical protein